MLPALLRAAGVAEGEDLVLGWYSAGYALARELTRHPADRAAIAVWVGLDGAHADLDPDGTASDTGIRWAVDLAKDARAGRIVFALGHSDVRTWGYASTTQFASELERLAGPPSAGFIVEAFNVAKADLDEHKAALLDWGPAFVARAVARLNEIRACPSTEPAGTPASLEAAVLAEAQAALEAGVAETSPNDGPVVGQYLRDAGVTPPASWCAAAARAWMHAAAKRLGIAPPVQGSPGAKAFVAQLDAVGRWTPREKLTAADLLPGRIIAWHRGAPGAWTGHIGVIERYDGNGQIHTIEGNSGPNGDRVARMMRRLDDPLLLGVGRLDA